LKKPAKGETHEPQSRFLKVTAFTTGLALCLIPLVRSQAARPARSATVQRTATTSDIPVTTPGSLATADFNGDLYPDLVVSREDATNRYVSIVLSNGSGGYLSPNEITVEPVSGTSPSYTVFTKDFNNDSKVDLGIVCFGIGTALGGILPTSVKYYQGDGAGGFAAPTTTSPIGGTYTDFLTGAAVGDLNGDSKLDFIFSARGPSFTNPPGVVSWAYGNGTGGFTDVSALNVNDAATGLTVGDFNNDSKLDIVVQSYGSSCSDPHCFPAIQSLIGDGAGVFVKHTMGPISYGPMVPGDFNNDGKLDLFSSHGIVLGDGLGGFTASAALPPGRHINPDDGFATVVGDFNHDGNLDGAMVFLHSRVGIFFGNGAGGFSAAHFVTPGIQPTGLAAADFDHNGKTDLTISIGGQNKVTIYHDDVLPELANSPVYDFDGDGRTDIAVYRPGASAMWYMLLSSDNTFRQASFGTTGDIPVPADYSGDGIAEIAVFRPSLGRWYVTSYPFTAFTTISFGQPGDIPVPGVDTTAFGSASPAFYRVSGGLGTFYFQAPGPFGSVVQFGNATDKPVVGDFDGDGKTDIAVYRTGATATDQSYWYILRSSDHAFMALSYGLGEDQPVPADFDGDQNNEHRGLPAEHRLLVHDAESCHQLRRTAMGPKRRCSADR
jgi:hypothetical protein